MPGSIAADVCNRFFNAANNLYRQNIIQIFRAPVRLLCGFNAGEDRTGRFISAQNHLLLIEPALDQRQRLLCNPAVHQKALACVAHRGTRGFRIENDLRRHFKICRLIDIDVAVAHARFNHRHRRMLHHRADQPAAAPGDQYIHIRIEPHQLIGGIARRIRHELDAILRKARLLQRGAHHSSNRLVGMDRLLAAAQDHRIAGFQAQRRGVGCYIGARLKNHCHNAEGHRHLYNLQAVRPVPAGEHLAHRVRQGNNLPHPLRHPRNTGLIQAETVKQSRAHARLLPVGKILRICLQNRSSMFQQSIRDLGKAMIFTSSGSRAQKTLRLLCPLP